VVRVAEASEGAGKQGRAGSVPLPDGLFARKPGGTDEAADAGSTPEGKGSNDAGSLSGRR
jgi:hypothetical protein